MPDWIPDWSSDTCVVVASGQSAKQVNVEAARGRAKVIVINESYRLALWADAIYAADCAWWEKHLGAREFKGLKVSQSEMVCRKYRVRHVRLEREDRIVTEPKDTIGYGGNSGFQALNLAVQFGAKRIVLVGYDLHGDHWHGRHPPGLNNPGGQQMERWRKALDNVAPQLKELGVEVLNASQISALTAYPKVTLEDVL